MNTSKLIILLKKLSSRELKKLEVLLRSPYFNQNEQCLELFLYLKKEILEGGKTLTRKQVFKQLYPEKTKRDSSLSVQMSSLLNFAQEVLVQEQLRLRPQTRNYLLLEGLGEKGDMDSIQQIGKKSIQKLNNLPKMRREDYQNNYLINNLLYVLEISAKRTHNQRIEQVVTALDNFYLIHRLHLTYEILNIQQILSMDQLEMHLEKLLAFCETISKDAPPLIRLNHLAVLLVAEPEDIQHFEQFLSLLLDSAATITSEELHSLYTIATNYCIQQIIKGNRSFYEKLLQIYQRMIDEKVLFMTRYIPPAQLKNVIALSCQLGKLEWAEDFLYNYKQFLDPKIRAINYDYNLATIYFYKQDYGKARELLIQTESMEVFFEVGRKFFLLKIYYELKEDIALYQLLESFKAFIRKNNLLSASLKKSYLNFAKMLKLLADKRIKRQVSQLQKLKDKLNGYQQVSDKKWLVLKIDELERSLQ